MNVAPLETDRQPNAAVLGQVNLDTRVPSPVVGEEGGQQRFDGLRRCADPQHSRLAALERPGPFTDGLGLRQQSAAAPEQVVAFGRELNATPDAIEQPDVQAPLQCLDLPGERRLTEIQPGGRPGHAAGIDDGDERAQVSKVHAWLMTLEHGL